jgi:chromosome segregation ATPase
MSEKEITAEEKYFNYYVETLTQTLNQQILTNVSSSAKAKVNNEVLLEWQKQNESLKQQLAEVNSQNIALQEDLKKQIEQLKVSAESNQTARESQKNAEIERLKSTINGKDEQIRNITSSKDEQIKNITSSKDEQIRNITVSKDEQIRNITASKDEQIKRLQSDVNRLSGIATEYDRVKNQVNHMETFKSELIKERTAHKATIDDYNSQIEELNNRIEYLQLTPAKRKKVNEIKIVPNDEPVLETSSDNLDTTIKDGGSF